MPANAARAIGSATLYGTPSIPVIADTALDVTRMPGGVSSLSALLRCDPVFVLRLLRASDALDCAPGGGIAGRIDAVVEAGGSALIQAALLDTPLHAPGRAGPPEGYRRFWAHSLLSAETARELSLRSGRCDPDEAYVAGLLLDVALPLLATTAEHGPLFAQGLGEQDLNALEIERFAVSHGEVAASLLPWGWAAGVADALRFHHTDTGLFGGAPELLRIVRAAEELSGGGAADAIERAALAHALTGLPMEHLNDAWQTVFHRVSGQLAALQLMGTGNDVPDGGLFRPRFEASPPDLPAHFRLLGVARTGLFRQVLDRPDEAGIWHAYRLSAALLLDLPRPQLLSGGQGGARFVALEEEAGGPGEQARIDLSSPGLSAIWEQLAQGRPWYAADAGEPAALPVSLQRVLRCAPDHTCLIQPMLSEGGVEALALHRIPLAAAAALRRRSAELEALAGATAQAVRVARTRARDLGELRRGMVEQYAAHSKQLRADLHTPLGLLKHQVKSMRLKMGADSMLESELSVFNDQVTRIDAVLRQFESRPPDLTAAAQWTDINQLIEQAVADVDERMLRARSITSELHLDSALPPLHLPLAVMRDLIASVLAASAEQIGSSGRIAISSADGVNWNGSLFAEIRVRDFGRGMDAARVAALFSTQATDGGSRHPLAQALAQARALGGSLSCKSALGQGTVFQLLLPRLTRRSAPGVPA